MKTLLTLVITICFFSTGGFVNGAQSEGAEKVERARRPNILLLFADDLGRYASAYSSKNRPSCNDVIQTPVFDRIAREGAIFNNAFASAPSCTPSRASLYTGRHFFRNASHSQLHHPWQRGVADPFDKVIGMPNQLATSGYHVGWSHKWHMRTSLIGGKKNSYNQHGNRINKFSQVISRAKDKEAAKQKVLNGVRGNFCDFLKARPEGKPFFYSFNPTNTHRQWVPGSGKDIWKIDPNNLEGRMPRFLPDIPEVREDFADYLGEAMAFDAACGVIIDELESLGELENTLVCISGDHGAPGFPRGKCNVYDFGARVLLAMRLPGKIASKRVVEVPVSLIDLAPTFLAAANLPPEIDTNGQDILPAIQNGGSDEKLRGWALIGRESHIGPCRPDGLPYPIRAIRTRDALYVVNFKPDRWPVANPPIANDFKPAMTKSGKPRRRMDVDHGPTLDWFKINESKLGSSDFWSWGFDRRPNMELYSPADDPDQLKNLIDNPEWQERRTQLHKMLFDELEKYSDPRLKHEFDRVPYNLFTTRRKSN